MNPKLAHVDWAEHAAAFDVSGNCAVKTSDR